ncbi:MAG: hypothetical protein O7F71_12660, partial [Gammaproteobacteria bacterium]|nr:hypothetical protein [Gammaproteobacteria bacterium]
MYPDFVRGALLIGLAGLLIACSGGTEKTDLGDDFIVSGYVGDASLVGASITVADANGETVFETVSDQTAQYEAQIPAESPMPLTITAQGGEDLVTGGATEFDLVAVAFSNSQIVNISPLTTLATRTAECSGAVSQTSIDEAWSLIQAEVSMGLDPSVNPMTQQFSTDNAAQLALANEAFREVLRRVRSALAGSGTDISPDEILTQIACDLEDDAVLNGVGPGADARTAATFRAAQAAVLLEIAAGELYVGGQDVVSFLDLAIETVLGSAGVSVGNVTVTDSLVDEAWASLSLFLVHLPDEEILTLTMLLGGADAATVAGDVAATLDAAHQTVLWGMPDRIALADSSEISALVIRMNQQGSASSPVISLAASETTVDNGSPTTLSWASADADRCSAKDGWTGEVGLDGSYTTAGLTHTTDYVLECVGLGGSSTATIQVVVTNPDPAPVTTLNVQNQTVNSGSATTLSWSSVNADQCQAVGAWTGPRQTSGSESTGALSSSQTFTLTCSGSGGSDTASVTVTVNAPPPAAPAVALSAADQVIDSGGSTTLTWSSSNATSCSASGGWSGTKGTSGNQLVGPLSTNTTFTLTCTGAGGSANTSTAVQVNAPPAPTVTLSAADQVIDSGASTTLTWSSSNATSCSASGGWSGTKGTSGNQLVGPLSSNTTFTLTCSGAGGNAVAMMSVNVNGVLSLSWVAPTENVDGSPLTDLTGYKIHYGDSSRNYSSSADINDANATS